MAAFQDGFTALIREFAATAQRHHQLAADDDPDRLTFGLSGMLPAANTNFGLHDDPGVLQMARRVVALRLGVE